VILSLAVFVKLLLVTDRQTDRKTHDDSIYRASIASRGKNTIERVCNDDKRKLADTDFAGNAVRAEFSKAERRRYFA